jgi:hypothetical protein
MLPAHISFYECFLENRYEIVIFGRRRKKGDSRVFSISFITEKQT